MRRRQRRWLVGAILAVWCGVPLTGLAQNVPPPGGGDREGLTDQAAAALAAGRDGDALNLLQQALAADPSDTRAQTYLAVAYYRMGKVEEARRALAAASIDADDPLPAIFDSIVRAELFDPSGSIAAARMAQARPRGLDVLRQVASDTSGAANLAHGYALVGQDERAGHVAQETFAPLWSGSHLFLRRQYPGAFSRRSSFIQGLLADPLALGASTRFHNLVPRSETYVTAGLRASNDRSEARVVALAPYATLSGQHIGTLPLAFLFDVTREHGFGVGDVRNDLRRRVPSTTVAFGVAPREGAFVVAISRDRLDDRYEDEASASDLTVDYSDHKVDVGLQYRFTPRSAVSLTVGTSGTSGGFARTLPVPVPAIGLVPFDVDDELSVQQLQVRHTMMFGRGGELSWGAESSTRRRDTTVATDRATSLLELVTDAESFDASGRVAAGASWVLEGRVGVTRTTDGVRATRGATVVERLVESSAVRVTGRAAIVRRLGAGRLARLVYQHWLRSPSESTLAPIATGGLPADERLVGYNGEAKDTRLQVEWTWSPSTFTTMFAAYRSVENPESWVAFAPLQAPASALWALDRVQHRWLTADVGHRQPDALSLKSATVRSGGVAVNHLINAAWAARARYEFTSSDAGSPLTLAGATLSAPYVPRHAMLVGATWASPERRVLARGDLSYRSQRHVALWNVHTLTPLDGDWVMNLNGRWELPNKQWAIEVRGRELFAQPSPFNHARFTADLSVRY